MAGHPAEAGPAGDGPAADRPAGDGPAADQPAGDGPAADQPAGDGQAADQPAGDGPAADRPAGDGPAADRPAADGPAPDRAAPDGAGPVSVLLAEHEPEVAEMSARYLRRDGLRVRLVTSPEHALAELTGGRHAAAVIDLTMPGLDPRRIRRALRTPVVFLVADPKGPRPRGLAVRGDAAGARRWLVRPFSPRQLVALVRDLLAVSARAGDLLELPGSGGTHPPGPKVPPRLAPAGRSVGALRLDVTRRILAVDGRRVPLTATECAVLAVMMDNPGRVQSRRQLLAAAGRQAAGDRAADVLIAQLRAKIGQVSAIRTVRRAGYALDP